MKMFDAQFGETSSPETKQLTAALAKAQAEFPSISLDADNSHLRTKYATYQQCAAALRGPLTKHGFALPQFSPCFHETLSWVCLGVLRHSSGEFVTGCVPLLFGEGKQPQMQMFGAALTYAKRQLLLSLTGAWVGEVDDDGESERETQQAVQSALTDAQRKQAASDKLEALAIEQLNTLTTREARAKFVARTAEHLSAKRLTQAAADRIAALVRAADEKQVAKSDAKEVPA